MSNTDTVTINLGELSPRLRAKLDSGEYGSLGELVRDGLEALDREDEALDDVLRRKIREAYDDPRPSIPAEEVFERLRTRHAERMKARRVET